MLVIFYESLAKFRVFASPDVLKILGPLSNDDEIKLRINQVVEEMKQDKNLGDQIRKRPWPDKYIRTHDVTNLYRRAVGGNHRLIYTIRGRKDDKVYQLLDLLTHKQYDKLFGYEMT